MKSNKFISVILSLAMLMSICGIQPIASAYDDTTTGINLLLFIFFLLIILMLYKTLEIHLPTFVPIQMHH